MGDGKVAPKKSQRNRRGDGTVYKAADGYFVTAIELPATAWNADGKPIRRRKVKRFKSRADANAQLREWRLQVHQSGDLPTTSITVSTWMQQWMTEHVMPNLRPRTAESYESIVRTYLIPALGANTRLDRITPAAVRKVTNFIESKGLSSTTARNAYRTLAKSLEQAVREGHLTSNPARRVEPPRASVTNLDVPDLNESVDMLGQALEGGVLGVMIATSILTTARRGEVLGLERDRVTDELDLSWQLQRLKRSHGCEEPCGRVRPAWCPQSKLIVPADYEHRHVTGSLYLTRPKSNAGWRIIPLVDPLRSILRHHLEQTPENPHGLVFARPDGSPIRPDEYTQAWVNFMRDYFDGERRIRLHDLRHAAVDLLYLAGVDEATIQEIAGHSTRQMTRAYKSRSSQARLREAMQRMAALPGITSQGEATPL